MPNTPQQQRRRERVEAILRLGAPFLDLLLLAGDRVSRLAGPSDDDYYAIRPGERLELGAIGPRDSGPEARQPEA
jgi:hypothetical protein